MVNNPQIEILESGHVNRSDSAFATLVSLGGENILCGFSVGGGAHASGGTRCARSNDGGRTWENQAVILEGTEQPLTSNHLRLSRASDGTIVAYGQRDYHQMAEGKRKKIKGEVVICRSSDEGRTWSEPQVVSVQLPGPYEISNPVVFASDGRWLAPSATHHDGRYGERVVLFESSDEGKTWPTMRTVFEHPEKKIGYLEQKIIECQPNRLLAVAWRQDFQKDIDLDNAISFSEDGGRTWSAPLSTKIQGQTMTPVWLGGDRFGVFYNFRYGRQTIQMCLVRASATSWHVEFEDTLWDPQTNLQWTDGMSSNEQISRITFGYPMAMRLDEETILATYWCEEEGVCGIRWTRLRVCL